MPKAEAPSAARRSARIASAGSGPAAVKEEAKKPAPEKKVKVVKAKEPKSMEPKSKETKTTEPKSMEPKAKDDKVTKSKDDKATKSKIDKPVSKAEKPVSKADKSASKEKAAASKESIKGKPKSKDSATDKPANGSKPASANRGVLQLGSGLPKIVLQNEDGEDVDVSTIAGERGVVIFLYPRADTPGCTNQACGFRDLHAEIGDQGYDVYGLSKDTPANQLKWRTKRELNYHLLSDPESKLIKRLGAFILPNNTKRSHFIFEKGTGKLIDIALNVKPADDPKNALKFIKEHHK